MTESCDDERKMGSGLPHPSTAHVMAKSLLASSTAAGASLTLGEKMRIPDVEWGGFPGGKGGSGGTGDGGGEGGRGGEGGGGLA